MIIGRDQIILGEAALDIRALLREIEKVPMTEQYIVGLGIGEPPTQLFTSLCEAGYLEAVLDPMSYRCADDEARGAQVWWTTVQGTALAKARIGKRIPRTKAQEHLDRFLDRVETVNADPEGLFWIEAVDLFGSFADPSMEEVGDLDFRVLAIGRHPRDEQFSLERQAGYDSGRSFGTMVELLTYAQKSLRNALKNRSPLIDIQLDMNQSSPLPVGATIVPIYRRDNQAR